MAQIEILGLYEGTPQIAAAQAGDGYKAPVTLQAATGNEVALELAYTVNKATSGNDTGLLISMTDTASPGTSLPLDIQVGGTSVASIKNDGTYNGKQAIFGVGSNGQILLYNGVTIDRQPVEASASWAVRIHCEQPANAHLRQGRGRMVCRKTNHS